MYGLVCDSSFLEAPEDISEHFGAAFCGPLVVWDSRMSSNYNIPALVRLGIGLSVWKGSGEGRTEMTETP
jgi:hypothetical protein